MLAPLLSSLLLAGALQDSAQDLSPAQLRKSIEERGLAASFEAHADAPVPLAAVEGLRQTIWERHQEEVKADPRRVQEHEEREIPFRDKVLRYASFTRGEPGEDGHPLYIALHGGGGAPARLNDGQWEHMKVYYRESVENGVYVATRGVTNTWNLHSVDESFPLYDRLIENMIAFESVDPDRVYVLGFSAGGDGTYQIAPRLADRLAAANMSAGHHNGISPRNLYHVPFLLQVGERDTAYGRHHATVQYAQRLAGLQEKEGNGYRHEVFVHAGRGHNFRDNDAGHTPQKVYSDPVQWMQDGEGELREQDTNAIGWLREHRRDARPRRLVWETGVRADRSGRQDGAEDLWSQPTRDRRFYWLGLPDGVSPGPEIVASYDPEARGVTVQTEAEGVLVLLSTRMLDLDGELRVTVGGQESTLTPRPTLGWMIRSVLERGDPEYAFEAALELRRDGEDWTVRVADAR